jgi:hypothetical protein
MTLTNARNLFAGAALFFACTPWAVCATPPGVDVNADEILRSMTSYMAGLKQFSVETENSIERVTADGQTIQFVSPGKVTVSRPDKLLAERRDNLADQVFYYDGKSLTLYNPGSKIYATATAPGNIDAMLEFAQEKLDVTAPAGDLIDSRSYDLLMQDVKSGAYIGVETVAGQRCHHLAYRAGEVDWQVWVHDGDRPYPCRYVITSKDVVGEPQFSVQVAKFDPAPKINQAMFHFVPPAAAVAVEFQPLSEAR